MLIAILIVTVAILIHQHFKFKGLNSMNDVERKLVQDLSDSFNSYSTKVGDFIAAKTKKIDELIANGADSPDFVEGINAQVAAINSAASHLVDFTVPTVTEESAIPVIPPAATELPAASDSAS